MRAGFGPAAELPASSACGLYLDGELWIGMEGYTLTSRGKVIVLDDAWTARSESVAGTHTIASSGHGQVGKNDFVDDGDMFFNYEWSSTVTRDGAVTPADARWASLRLWQDANHDGRADSGEITTLDAASVGSLSTVASWNGRRDRHGNLFQWKSLASVGGQQRPFYDVYFVTE